MATAGIHKAEAKRYVRVAQVAGLGLAFVAAVLWAVEVPGVNAPFRKTAAPEPVAAPPVDAPVVRTVSLDRASAVETAARLQSATRIREATESKATPGPSPDPTPTAATGGWRYLGPIYEGSAARALVSFNGRQRVLREGAEWDGVKLVSVAADAIVVEDSGGRREVRRGVRDGSPVAWLRAAPPGRPGTVSQMTRNGTVPMTTAAHGGGSGSAGSLGPAGHLNGTPQSRSLDRLRRGRDSAAAAAASGVPGSIPDSGGASPEETLASAADTPEEFTDKLPSMVELDDVTRAELAEVMAKLRGAVEAGQMTVEQYHMEMRREYEQRGIEYPYDSDSKEIPEDEEEAKRREMEGGGSK